jgi:hypothetical protein
MGPNESSLHGHQVGFDDGMSPRRGCDIWERIARAALNGLGQEIKAKDNTLTSRGVSQGRAFSLLSGQSRRPRMTP